MNIEARTDRKKMIKKIEYSIVLAYFPISQNKTKTFGVELIFLLFHLSLVEEKKILFIQ